MASILLEAVITGILTGSVYALMASGLTLIYGVLGIINVAQGILIVLSAYLSYVLEQSFHLDLFASLIITMPILFLLGIGIEWGALRRLNRAGNSHAILVMFAVALIIEGSLSYVFTTNYVQLQAWYIDTSFQIGPFYVAYIYIFVCVLSLLLLAGLYLLVYRTKFGYGLRASMQNRTAAQLIGIDVEKISTITFGIGIALAAAGGVAFGATNAFNPASSYDLISRLLVIIVMGGMGSLLGAFLAAILMLVIGDVTAVIWSPAWSSTIFFLVLAILLVVRPQGLFGQSEVRKQ